MYVCVCVCVCRVRFVGGVWGIISSSLTPHMKTFLSSHYSSPPAPVSDVDLSISCSANGEWRLRCSSNGHSPQYSWYLDGRPLSEADADLSADNQTLLLSRNVTGELTCSISNHISSKNTSVLLLDACSGQLVGHYFTSE